MPDLDHRLMNPPFLREVDEYQVSGYVGIWDLRLSVPNFSFVPPATTHSLEHFLNDQLTGKSTATVLGDTESPRTAAPAVLLVAPMGCATGLKIVTTVPDFDTNARLVQAALASVMTADSVPLANNVQCGRAELHSLQAAQDAARYLLKRYPDWQDCILSPDVDPAMRRPSDESARMTGEA